jgi:hypothetical protein
MNPLLSSIYVISAPVAWPVIVGGHILFLEGNILIKLKAS